MLGARLRPAPRTFLWRRAVSLLAFGVNKARLEWHKDRQKSNADYFRKRNASAMAEWQEANLGADRNDPLQLEALGQVRGEKGLRLVNAALHLDGDRREGALKRAGRLLREEYSMFERAAALRRGEKPLDEWAVCRCGSAFAPGVRAYTMCYTCSSKDWIATSFACVFCDRRHSMSYPTCFSCKQLYSEDDARFVRLMVNRRDNYTCQICGIDAMETGAELQVDHINPEGGNWPWNLQTLCTGCEAMKGKNYEKHDERAYFALVQMYLTYLFDYLTPEEQAALLAIEPDTDHEQIDFARRQTWMEADSFIGRCKDCDGLMNVISMLGAVVA